MIAWVRKRFLEVSMRSSLLVVTVGGAIVLAIGIAIGFLLSAALGRDLPGENPLVNCLSSV